MHMGCIVIACNSGGPLESIVEGQTGFLCKPDETLWGEKMFGLLEDSSSSTKI